MSDNPMRRIARDWFHIDWPRDRDVPAVFEETEPHEIADPWFTFPPQRHHGYMFWPGWAARTKPKYELRWPDGRPSGQYYQMPDRVKVGQRVPLRTLPRLQRPLPDEVFWSPEDLGLPDALLENTFEELTMQLKLMRAEIGQTAAAVGRLDPAQLVYRLKVSDQQPTAMMIDPATGESLHVIGPGVVKRY